MHIPILPLAFSLPVHKHRNSMLHRASLYHLSAIHKESKEKRKDEKK
jgi:hypothetical protein